MYLIYKVFSNLCIVHGLGHTSPNLKQILHYFALY